MRLKQQRDQRETQGNFDCGDLKEITLRKKFPVRVNKTNTKIKHIHNIYCAYKYLAPNVFPGNDAFLIALFAANGFKKVKSKPLSVCRF